jgi:hypothetical protein
MLSKNDIEDGLKRLGEIAEEHGMIIDISVYGGSALAIAWNSRVATKDVDAVAHGDAAFLRKACQQIAEEKDWPEDWLNDGVKGFLSSSPEIHLHGVYPAIDHHGIRVYVPSAEYMLALKCMAMRPEGVDGSQDIDDIKFLIKEIGLTTADAVLDIVERFYPKKNIQPKVRFGVEEIIEGLQNDSSFDPK